MDTSPSPAAFTLFVGIDIAAQSASVNWVDPDGQPGRGFTIKQTPAGLVDLQQRLLKANPQPTSIHAVLEATSNHWMSIAQYLHRYGFAVSVINPRQTASFAETFLQRTKTDAKDALTLAQLCRQLQPKLWSPPPPIYEELYQRLVQRENLVLMSGQLRNRVYASQQRPIAIASVGSRQEELIALMHQQILSIDRELPRILRQDADWNATAKCVMSIKGIGLITATWLQVMSINFTACQTPEQLVAFAGLAPYTRQSGTSLDSHRWVGSSGHARLRKLMFIAALSAVRFNPVIHTYYARLTARGKNGKVAMVAAARKLLHIAWAVGTKQEMFDPDYRLHLHD